MSLDNRMSVDESNQVRDHRDRSANVQGQGPGKSPGTPTERTQAGGPTPVSRPELQQLREASAGAGESAKQAEQRRATELRKVAEHELGRMLRLPADTRLDITVHDEEVRFEIRERRSGRLIKEVPPDERKPLLEKLKEFSGALVDRSF